MNRNLYCRISLALSIIFLLTKDVHALTVASDHEASPLQTLEAPSIEPHSNSEETTIRLFIYNPNERASTELYRSTSSTSGFQLIATLAPGASDVLANTTYHYTVNTVLENEGSPYLENVAEATVTTSGASTRCANVGSIERERWDNIPGLEISAIPTGTDPDKVTTLTSFEAPTNEGSNFGARIRGYICVPATGVALQRERTTSDNERVTLELKPSIVPGIYLIKVFNSRKRWMSKIQVK